MNPTPVIFSKLKEPSVIDIINFNKALIELFNDLVDQAFLHFRAELSSKFDSYIIHNRHENEETEEAQFKINLQAVRSTNKDNEIDGNNQTQNVEIGN